MENDQSSFAHQTADWRAQAMANFPFEIVETNGTDAFSKWKELKDTGRGAPVVVGTDVANILERREGLDDPHVRLGGAHP